MQVVHSLSKLTFQMKKICPAQWFTVRNLRFILVKSYSMPVDIPTHNLCDQNSKHCNIRASMILKVLTWIGFFFYICLFWFFFFEFFWGRWSAEGLTWVAFSNDGAFYVVWNKKENCSYSGCKYASQSDEKLTKIEKGLRLIIMNVRNWNNFIFFKMSVYHTLTFSE